MNIEQFSRRDERHVREYEADGAHRIVADLGSDVAANVEVVGDTAIVVPEEGDQIDLDLPEDGAKAFIKNGILTIELEDGR
ncbi:DUF7127 family protein [Natranaeroarchaeum aerophilus]|uniref:Hsp20/alpha crystallin family protein n=1 Tax=Natranaeroarchaeum aerophilus TaxID=2917711 RepID=A0AAE3FQH8_9EURY|nr:Hsp20/alpha crystallin family protein [Natranaeroarchaeum aerophilus]MCL9813291.1 Hsp20/alpha crystallin family protein [Natranaeroarchaeum aerophilus]